MRDAVPIIVLGGSDRKPAELPEQGRGKHPLSGYKGVDIRFHGRALIEVLVERLDGSGCFGPVYIAGPASVYAPILGRDRVIDADGSFGENIATALEWVRTRHPGSPIGFISCDVLPEIATLQLFMQHFARHRPCDFWFPLIRAPRDPAKLGASGWKPSYRIVTVEGEPPLAVLPGHLTIVDPEALRRKFVYRLFELGYRTRNRPIGYRLVALLRGVLVGTLYQDLLHAFTLQAPTQTWWMLWAAIPGAASLKAGKLTRATLEAALRGIFVRTSHRRRYPQRRVLLPVLEGLSLALDIDTEEEAREMGGEL